MHEIACCMRQIAKGLPGDGLMAFTFDKHLKSRRGQQHLNKPSSLLGSPRSFQHLGMSDYSQEFVENTPSDVPRRLLAPPSFQKLPAVHMGRCVFIGCIDQHIGIDGKHYRPSMA